LNDLPGNLKASQPEDAILEAFNGSKDRSSQRVSKLGRAVYREPAALLEDEEHASYASTLWLSMGILVDLEWERHPRGAYYPALELGKRELSRLEILSEYELLSGRMGCGLFRLLMSVERWSMQRTSNLLSFKNGPLFLV